tara:strand:- start:155 stop:511 length:357 start_codon:yes stop_codon:yes gene_type:complete
MTEENKTDDLVSAVNNLTAVLQSLTDIVHDSAKNNAAHMSKTEVYLDEISRGTLEIAKAFGFHDGQPGSVYHIAGSLNSIKFGMPNYKPKRTNLGRSKNSSNLKRDKDTVLDQPVDIR